MEQNPGNNTTEGGVRRRVSKLRPPTNYHQKSKKVSSYSSGLPTSRFSSSLYTTLQSTAYQTTTRNEDRQGKDFHETPDIVTSCDSKVTIHQISSSIALHYNIL